MRLGIFLLYDQEGHVSDHVLYLLAKFSEHIDDLIVISNGPITPESAEKIGPYVSQIVVRDNEGFDVGGYKHGILEVGFDHIAKYDELVLFNYTVFGPIFDLSEMFGAMDERDIDFWGVTEFTDGRKLFLQSYFLVTRRKLHSSADFRDYWLTMPEINSIQDSLDFHEFRFTPFFIERGYRKDVYVQNEASWQGNTTLADLPGLLRKRLPIIKYRAFNFEPRDIERRGALPAAANFKLIESTTSYPIDLIWEYIIAQTDTDRVIDAITGTKISFGDNGLGVGPVSDVDVIVFLSVEDEANAELLAQYLSKIDPSRLFVASSKPALVDFFASLGCQSIKVALPVTGAPIVAFRDRILQIVSDNDIVLNLSCFVGERDVYSFRQLVLENYWGPLVGSLETLQAIGAWFKDNPRLGLLFPPTDSILGRVSRAGPLCPRASNWNFQSYPPDLSQALRQSRWPWRGNAAFSGRFVRSPNFLARLAALYAESKPEGAPRICGMEGFIPELARKAGFACALTVSAEQASKLVTRGSADEHIARQNSEQKARKFTAEITKLREGLARGSVSKQPDVAEAIPEPARQARPKTSAPAPVQANPTATPVPKISASASVRPAATPAPKPSASAQTKPTATTAPKPSAPAQAKPAATPAPKPSAPAQAKPTATPVPKPSAPQDKPPAALAAEKFATAPVTPKPAAAVASKPVPARAEIALPPASKTPAPRPPAELPDKVPEPRLVSGEVATLSWPKRWLEDRRARQRVPALQEQYGQTPLFVEDYYLKQFASNKPRVPLVHFHDVGWRQQLNPSPFFDVAFYLASYPDVRRAQVNPLLHYVEHGWREGRSPHPSFDPASFLKAHPDIDGTKDDPAAECLKRYRTLAWKVAP